ncbi:phytanoyl-CoA dioxygenase family protein [bacterium]|nr:phytanoyl-CoA dioxygenase family protein [bacterium]
MTTTHSDDDVPREFAEQGIVALRRFLVEETLAELASNVERLIQDVVPTMSADDAFYEDKSDRTTLKQLQRIEQYDSWFGDLPERVGLRRLAETLLGGPVIPKGVEFFCKPPGVGRPTPAHQDGYYFRLDPCEALTMWLALDEIDDENGCVWYVPGSHRDGMRNHSRTQTLGFSQGIVDYPTDEDARREVSVPASPGDLLIHHALTIHRAGANRSASRLRRALGFVYFSERARVDEAAQAAYQKKLAAEMRAAGQI